MPLRQPKSSSSSCEVGQSYVNSILLINSDFGSAWQMYYVRNARLKLFNQCQPERSLELVPR
jgi:hypothetical protein